MTEAASWDAGRFEERVRALDKALERLEYDIRVLMPLTGQIGGLEADVDAVERELANLRLDLVTLRNEALAAAQAAATAAQVAKDTANTTANEVIRSGRTENLKLIGIIVGAFTTIAGTIITLYATGKLGGVAP